MNEHLQFFYRWFWFSLAIVAVLGCWIFIVTRRRNLWLRITAAEAAFWIRLGVPKRFTEASRRCTESRPFVYFLWFAMAIWLFLLLFNGKSYLHFKHTLPTKKPPEAESFYDEGADQNKAGHYIEAISNFSMAIEVFSNYAEAYSFRAKAKYNLEDYSGAIIDGNKAIELNSDFEPAYNVLGLSKFSLKDYAGSIIEFTKSIKLDSAYAPAYYQCGLAEANLTNYSTAIKDFTKAIKLKEDYALAYYDRGQVEQALTNYTAAIMDYSNAIDSHADFPAAYNMQGLAKWYLKDYYGAITDYTVAIELNPKFSYAYSNRGLAKSDLNNYSEAIADLDVSLNLNPHNEFAYFNRGYAKYHLKDYKGAIADFNKQIEINSKDASAFAYLGYIQSDLFQFHPALNNFQTALQLDPSGTEYRFRIWSIRSRLDDMLGASYDLNNYLISLNEKKITWPTAVGFYLVGSFSEKNFLACARSSDQKTRNWWQCRANYYAGIKHLSSGDKVGAMDFFHECLNTKETNLVEYTSAEAEFNALKKIIPR